MGNNIKSLEEIDQLLNEYFENTPKEKIEEELEKIKKINFDGPTVNKYFSVLSGEWPVSDLSKITSGKIWSTVDMVFSREKFHGIKLIDDPNFNFSLIEVVEATEHPIKQVDKGIRVYRVEWGTGTFTIIHEGTSFYDQIEVGAGDTILIKAGDYYKYEGKKLKLFEVNIKYP